MCRKWTSKRCDLYNSTGISINNPNLSSGTIYEVREVEIIDKSTLKLVFAEKQRAVTVGQFAVLYDENGKCYGGGRINELIK